MGDRKGNEASAWLARGLAAAAESVGTIFRELPALLGD